MITATLCSTNGNEPWGANVPFELKDGSLTTKLKTEYLHYQNLKLNPKAVIVYSSDNLELIIKAKAKLSEPNDGVSQVVFEPNWMRVVEAGNIEDLEDSKEVAAKLNQLLG
jgi:hypothetical protein